MLTLNKQLRVYYAIPPTDMRKSFDGLIGLVQDHWQLEPSSNALFVFRNRRGDRVKLLYWDQDGFALWYKRLEQGTFQIPPSNDQPSYVSMSASDLALLLDGVDLSSIRRRKRYSRAS